MIDARAVLVAAVGMTGCTYQPQPLAVRTAGDYGNGADDDRSVGDRLLDALTGDGLAGDPAVDCAGAPDFTPCVVITSPDREWDICIDGVCRSPGCGTWECNPPGPGFALADSGQRSCWDGAGNAFTCPALSQCGAGQWCGQDAQYGWDTLHLSTERFTRVDAVANQPVIVDQVTGLAWQACANDISGADCSVNAGLNSLPWIDAVSYCEQSTWGGHSDWRLPSDFELHSLVSHDRAGPSIDAIFPNAGSYATWSSSASGLQPDQRWYANFYYGQMRTTSSSSGAQARCVRQHTATLAPPTTRFARNTTAEPVVVDFATGLVWQGCPMLQSGMTCAQGSESAHSWSAALNSCETLEWGGQTDWSLPNVVQLRSLVRHDDTSAIHGSLPQSAVGFWSSTSGMEDPAHAFIVEFATGDADLVPKTGPYLVRCVRAL